MHTQVSWTSDLLVGRADSLATYTVYKSRQAVLSSRPTTTCELHCFPYRLRQAASFVFRPRGPRKLIPLLQSRFKIRSDSYGYIDMVSFSRIFSARCRCFGDLLAGSMDDEGIASVVAAPFAVTLTMCHYEGKCTERGTSSLGKDTNSDLRRTVKKKKKERNKRNKKTYGGPALLYGIQTSWWQKLEDSGKHCTYLWTSG